MSALVRKDISLNLRPLAQSAVIATVIILVFSRMESGITFIAVWSLMLPHSYALMSCYTEELNKGLVFCRCLPVAPSVIVWSKLAGFLVVTIASSLYVFLLGLLTSYAGWLKVPPGPPLFISVIGPWVFLFIFHGVLLYVFFIYGYKKAQTVVSMMSLLFLLPLVLPATTQGRAASFMGKIFGDLRNGILVVSLLVAAAFAVDVALTWRAAKIFAGKDLT